MNTSSLDGHQEGTNLGNHASLFCPEQNTETPNNLDSIDACHPSSPLVVHEKAIGMKTPVERHRFELALTQAYSCDHEFLQVHLYDLASEIKFQSVCFGLFRHNAFPKNSRGNTYLLEEFVEGGQGVTRSESYERGGISNDQHQAFGRKAASSARSSSTG